MRVRVGGCLPTLPHKGGGRKTETELSSADPFLGRLATLVRGVDRNPGDTHHTLGGYSCVSHPSPVARLSSSPFSCWPCCAPRARPAARRSTRCAGRSS